LPRTCSPLKTSCSRRPCSAVGAVTVALRRHTTGAGLR
jgi:hypothetical protein